MYLCLFAGALLLALWLLQIVFLDSFYKAYKRAELKKAAQLAEDNIDNSQLDALLQEIANQQGLSLLVADPDTLEILYRQDSMKPGLLPNSPRQIQRYWQAAEQEGGSYIQTQSRRLSGERLTYRPSAFTGHAPPPMEDELESILCARAVSSWQGRRLILLVSVVTPVGSTAEALQAEFWFICALLAVFALGLALLTSRKISAPIIRLNQAAKRLGKGQFDVEFQGGGYREIHELSDTMAQAARQLGRQDDLRRELLANVSHDLRTPLTMIIGYAEAIRDLPGEDTPENIQVIIDEAARLNQLVTDLLDLSKLQAQSQPLDIQVFCLTDSVREALARLDKLASAAGYQVIFRQDREVYVRADELRLSQVIYNLVGNAIAHTGEDRRVVVDQLTRPGFVRIQVTDSGPGVPSEERQLIWERYYKKSKNNRRPDMGSGLGLAIAKAALIQHGALYGVESGPDHGSIFWFELPAEPEAEASAPE
ncbi:MAG: HAMP domain-containing histidine kinase [Clostridiaceae bacterium]|jgi:signal transduction histidine kinase|nr:HAMP domain-containing histidine kinase [Clostridiaceae bacterium]